MLASLGVTLEEVRGQVGRIVGMGDKVESGQIHFTPRAKKVLELSLLREAQSLNHDYIGTEHVLLGLARENEGVAMRILLDLGVDAEAIRNDVIHMLGGVEPRGTRVLRQRFVTRRRRLVPAWTTLVAGGAVFAAGLIAGWLIWA